MKKILCTVVFAALSIPSTHAAEPVEGEASLSLGGASAHLNLIDDVDIPGVSALYNFTPLGQRVGFAGAATLASGTGSIDQPGGPSVDLDAFYLSLLVGPSYQFTEHLRGYGLLGAAYGEAELGSDFSSHEITLAYGAGIQLTHLGQFLVDLHVEGVGAGGGNTHLDGQLYSLGVGYQF